MIRKKALDQLANIIKKYNNLKHIIEQFKQNKKQNRLNKMSHKDGKI